MLEAVSKNGKEFGYHPRWSEIQLTHLRFVDELLLFSVAILQLKKVLLEFAELSGLQQIQQRAHFTVLVYHTE